MALELNLIVFCNSVVLNDVLQTVHKSKKWLSIADCSLN